MERSLSPARRRWLCAGLCAAIFLPRAYLALHDRGLIWSDEIFQTLEQGHRLAFGYGLVPWEFRAGARSWLLPGAIGEAMKALAALGVAGGAGLAASLKLGFATLAALAFYPMLRLAEAWAGLLAVILLAAVAIAFPASLIYSSRAMAEVASAPFLAWGLWVLWPLGMGRAGRQASSGPDPGHRACSPSHRDRLCIAGALLGLATLLRYQDAILLPPIVLLVAARRSLRAGVWVALGAFAVLILGGLLDWATWGRPFQSLLVYLRFNLVQHGADQWGVARRDFFLRSMLATNGLPLLILAAGFLAGVRRTWPVAVLVLVFVGVHSLVPHKELRFLYPVLPLFLACAAVGMAAVLTRLPFSGRVRLGVTCVLAAGFLGCFSLRARRVTFSDIGQVMQDPGFGGPTSPLVWGAFGERTFLFEQAGTHADICGLAAPAMNPYWSGGYTYLHRRVPLLWSGSPAALDAANYALIGPRQTLSDARFHKIAQSGPYALYRRDGGCRPPPPGSGRYGRLLPAGVPGT